MLLISSGKRDKRKAVMGSQAMPFWKVLTLLSGLATQQCKYFPKWHCLEA
ncbi:uncharacterized protein METZ01_LOCUS204581, partial [marine metagenome]